MPLKEELDALRLYIEMEHRRANGKFDYAISVAANLESEPVFIPPLLLQPYVENAIWHGLSQRETRGRLAISIEKSGDTLHCTIDDDGIGRRAAAQIKSGTGSRKSSLAMNISSQRIAWLQKDAGLPATVAIEDKFSGTLAAGTVVQLIIPLKMAHA